MNKNDLKNGDIIKFDYITEFTKEHIIYNAILLWKDNSQPLIVKFDKLSDISLGLKYNPVWSCYDYISKVIGHININIDIDMYE